MGEPRVVPLTADRADETGLALAAGFHDDPLFSHLFPRASNRAATLYSLMRAEARASAKLGVGYVAIDDGQVLGASLWTEPGKKRSLGHQVREALSGWRALAQPRGAFDGIRIVLATDARRPNTRHRYLGVLAVDPSAQGRGVGRALIAVGLRSSDEDGDVTYLETAKQDNLAWYSRFGFEEIEELRPVASRPPVWVMSREPRPAG